MDILHFIFLWFHYATDWQAMTPVDYCLVGFNSVEALIWFGCAAYVFRRNARLHNSRREQLYGVLFILFGMTDIVETIQVSSPLIWIKRRRRPAGHSPAALCPLPRGSGGSRLLVIDHGSTII